MDRAAVTKIHAVLILIIIVFSGMGGAVYWWFMQPKAFSVVWGEVSLDEPLVGATVTIYDLSGNKVFEEKDATYETGGFIFRAAWGVGGWGGEVPKEFKIVATGGTLGNEAFTGRVERIVHNYTEGDYYVANAITTLIAAYMDKHPEVGYAEAEEVVKEFLGVSSDVDIVNVIEYDTSYFDPTGFMFQAEGAGGFDAFVESLVEELEDGKTHPFILSKISPAVKAFGGKFFKKLGWGIVSGIGSWTATTALGWVFDSIFGSEEEKFREEMNQRLDQMEQQLSDIQGGVKRLEEGQEQIKAKLDVLSKQIADEFKALREQLGELEWIIKEENFLSDLRTRRSNLDTAIVTPISQITARFNTLCHLSNATLNKKNVPAYKKTAEEQITAILGDNSIESKLIEMHKYIVPFSEINEPSEMGLLQVWSTLATKVAAQHGSMTDVYLYLENRFAYLLDIQYKGINLVIDANHGRFGNDTYMAEVFWNDEKVRIEEQVDVFLRCVERMVCSRIDTLTSWELNKVAGEYVPPVILQMADEFAGEVLSGLVGEEEGKGGVLTARIANYPHFTGRNLADKIDLRFQNIETGAVFRANFTERRDGYTIENAWGDTYKYELLYYEFEVPLGSCKLVSLEDEASDLLIPFFNNQTTTITVNNTYGSYGMMAYSPLTPRLLAKWGSYGGGLKVAFKADKNGKYVSVERPSYYSVVNRDWIGPWETLEMIDLGENKVALKTERQPNTNNEFLGETGGLYVNAVYSESLFKEYLKLGLGGCWFTRLDLGDGKVALMGSRSPKFVGVGEGDKLVLIASSIGSWETFEMIQFGVGDGMFDMPYDVAVDGSGNVYVADTYYHRIQKFDSSGNFITKWGSWGSGDGQFQYPCGLAVDSNGNVYVADKGNNRVQKFDSSGKFLANWGRGGSLDGEFVLPSGLAVDSNGNVYVADKGNNRVQKFASNGSFLTKWGSEGTGDGQFRNPTGVDVDSNGNVYVIDSENHRVQKFNSSGSFITKWGSEGSEDGNFKAPYGVAVDIAENVYITDSGNNRIQKFDSNGHFITKWGSYGSGDGQFSSPFGVAVDSLGNIYVTDGADNHRVQKFGWQVGVNRPL